MWSLHMSCEAYLVDIPWTIIRHSPKFDAMSGSWTPQGQVAMLEIRGFLCILHDTTVFIDSKFFCHLLICFFPILSGLDSDFLGEPVLHKVH